MGVFSLLLSLSENPIDAAVVSKISVIFLVRYFQCQWLSTTLESTYTRSKAHWFTSPDLLQLVQSRTSLLYPNK